LDDNLQSCFEDEDYIAWKAKADSVKELKGKIAVLEGEFDKNECTISRARLPNRATYGEKSVACLEMMAQSCFDELDRLTADRNPDCVECNMRSPAGN
jgi:hypothetical protein